MQECGLPEAIQTEGELDELLATPSEELVDMMRRLEGDLMILGAAGKMGVSMAAAAASAAKTAGSKGRVIAVSRFSDASLKAKIEAAGVETLSCDLLDRRSVATLPKVGNVVFMAGRKFGTTGDEALTWVMNTVAPANVAEHFAGSRIVAMSTGCVYPLIPLEKIGCREEDTPAPFGDYSQSCLGRERIFQHYCATTASPTCLIRLNYAVELRYGVLHDIARRIWDGQPVTLSVPHFNAIWQGDANDQILRSLELCAIPARFLNVTGPETMSVKTVAEEIARLMDKPVTFADKPGSASLLSDATEAAAIFGYPKVALRSVLRWTADWVAHGGASLGKPTHFEVGDGKF